MTNHLRPEQRVDRNGRVVTRHVRTETGVSAAKGNLPAPKVGKPKSKPKKLKEHQLEQTRQNYSVYIGELDKKLVNLYNPQKGFSFTSNEVETLEVLGAVKGKGNALLIMSLGVRSAEEAEEFLTAQGARHLIADPDQREVAQRSLENNVPPSIFQTYYENFSQSAKGVDQLVDALAFYTTSLGEQRYSSFTRDLILKGEVSFADIKAVGITRLKSYDRLHALEGFFD